MFRTVVEHLVLFNSLIVHWRLVAGVGLKIPHDGNRTYVQVQAYVPGFGRAMARVCKSTATYLYSAYDFVTCYDRCMYTCV